MLLLDDLLSAVDVHVGKFLVKEALMKYVSKKTRLLVTHALYYLKYVDKIFILEAGEIVDAGDYDKIRSTRRFQAIYENLTKGHESELPAPDAESEDEGEDREEETPDKSRVSMAQTDYAHDISPDKKVIENQASDKVMNELMMAEDKAVGEIPWSTYAKYFSLNGGFLFGFTIFIAMALWQVSNLLFNIWLAFWTEDRYGKSTSFYLGIYFFLGFLYGFFAFMRAITFAFSNTAMSRFVHRSMQENLLFSSLNEFFDRVPMGRILNRLSKDLNTIDSNFPNTLGNFLSFGFFVLGNVVMCVVCSSAWFIIPIILYLLACYFLKNYYMRPSRACVRLENITKSPIVSCFT